MADEIQPNHLGFTKLEMRGRESHTSPSGAMSIRKFYIEPFEKWELVAEAIEGWVTTSTKDAEAERHLPATDVYFVDPETGYNAFMFATEIRVTPVDKDYVSISNTPPINIKLNNPKDTRELKMYLQEYTKREYNAGGAFIEVVYRPEISLYSENREKSWTDEADTTRLFDYLSPEFKSRIINMANPDGLLIKTGSVKPFLGSIVIPPESANPITLSVVDFTIRRSLVPHIPWKIIQNCVGRVNKSDWELTGTDLTFKKETVKFAGPISIKRGLSSFHKQKIWWEIIYLFQIINQDAEEMLSDDGTEVLEGQPVTWNHGFFSPKWTPLWGSTLPGDGEDLGKTMWYPIYRREYVQNWGVSYMITGEKLYDATDDFNKLFDIKEK